MSANAVAADLYTPLHAAVFSAGGAAGVESAEHVGFHLARHAPRAALAMGVMIVAIVLMWTEPENPFIYFQF